MKANINCKKHANNLAIQHLTTKISPNLKVLMGGNNFLFWFTLHDGWFGSIFLIEQSAYINVMCDVFANSDWVQLWNPTQINSS